MENDGKWWKMMENDGNGCHCWFLHSSDSCWVYGWHHRCGDVSIDRWRSWKRSSRWAGCPEPRVGKTPQNPKSFAIDDINEYFFFGPNSIYHVFFPIHTLTFGEFHMDTFPGRGSEVKAIHVWFCSPWALGVVGYLTCKAGIEWKSYFEDQ